MTKVLQSHLNLENGLVESKFIDNCEFSLFLSAFPNCFLSAQLRGSFIFASLFITVTQDSIKSKVNGMSSGRRSRNGKIASTNSIVSLVYKSERPSRHAHQQKSIRSKFLMAGDFGLLPSPLLSLRT